MYREGDALHATERLTGLHNEILRSRKRISVSAAARKLEILDPLKDQFSESLDCKVLFHNLQAHFVAMDEA